jgi:hypothetical protein
LTISYSTFTRNQTAILVGSEQLTPQFQIKHNVFTDNGVGVVANFRGVYVGYNLFEANDIAISAIAGNMIEANRFQNNGLGVVDDIGGLQNGSISIYQNSFDTNYTAIVSGYSGSTVPMSISHNEFSGGGQIVFGINYGCMTTIRNNNIVSAASVYIQMQYLPNDCTIDAVENWWGTTSEALIEQKFDDPNQVFDPPYVIYKPYATSPIDNAGIP